MPPLHFVVLIQSYGNFRSLSKAPKSNGRAILARPCGPVWSSAQAECYPASLEDEVVKEPEIERQGAYNSNASRQHIRVLFVHAASHEEVSADSEQDEYDGFHGGADIRGTCIHRRRDSDADSIANPLLFQGAEDVDDFVHKQTAYRDRDSGDEHCDYS